MLRRRKGHLNRRAVDSIMAYVIPVTLEETPEGWLAYNDDLHVLADGASKDAAMKAFRECVDVHVAEHGIGTLKPFEVTVPITRAASDDHEAATLDGGRHVELLTVG